VQSKKYEATRLLADDIQVAQDVLVSEAPLQITINGVRYVTTMRTPDTHDLELARGLLFTEGILSEDIQQLTSNEIVDPETGIAACLEIDVDESYVLVEVEGRRNQWSTSSCGVCGTRDAEDIAIYGAPLSARNDAMLEKSSIAGLFETLEAEQVLFHETGGSHGAAIFGASEDLLVAREDIGRHNAVDKAIGHLLVAGKLPQARILLVSGRVSYEIVYKAYRAAIPILLSVSAPSSMAVDTCVQFGITLVAYCRENRATVYSHPERITGLDE